MIKTRKRNLSESENSISTVETQISFFYILNMRCYLKAQDDN